MLLLRITQMALKYDVYSDKLVPYPLLKHHAYAKFIETCSDVLTQGRSCINASNRSSSEMLQGRESIDIK